MIALGPIGLLARLDDCRTVTVGTLHRTVNHLLPPRNVVMRSDHRVKLLICNITQDMISRARTTRILEAPLLLQAKRSGSDTLLKLYIAIDEDLKVLHLQ